MNTSRRNFLKNCAAVCSVALISKTALKAAEGIPKPADLGFPLVDFHVHLDNSTIEKVMEIARQRNVQFGIVEHAGTKENVYPVVLSSDDDLKKYMANLSDKPVFKGVQAEWIDWMGCFSREVLGQLDYVLTDAMTIRDKNGKRVKMWESGYEIGEKQAFMDRYVDWHVEIMATEPIDIFANLTWLPNAIIKEYETLWTEQRMTKIIEAALKYGVALEISSSMKIPKMQFLKLAKVAGAKFSLGSNGRYPNMGKLEYSIEMARILELKPSDLFKPASQGEKAVQRRKY